MNTHRDLKTERGNVINSYADLKLIRSENNDFFSCGKMVGPLGTVNDNFFSCVINRSSNQ